MLSWRITYMERTARPENGAPPPPANAVTFAREVDITLDAYRDLHRKVGEEWLWWERLALDDADLRAAIRHPATEIFVLRVDAELAGFVELDRSDP
ncbi:MAG: GNAT family N-acetyltransferase, partial [Alphaproteobacteria bacterium]|nr:GNAT family N-acetyltransferase [Alphaproteobacteria bacterium]